MNAKIKLTLAVAMAGLTLASCGGKSLSRADAEAQMGVIANGNPETQTKVTYENGSDKVVVSTDDNYIHYVGAVIDSSKKTTNYDIYAWVADSVVNLRYSNGTDKLFYSTSNTTLQSTITAGVSARVNAYAANGKSQAAYLKSFFEKVDAADSGSKTSITRGDGKTVETGATPGNAGASSYVYFGKESYKSSGDGNLIADFELMYPVERSDAEKEYYVWENYLLKEIKVDTDSSNRHVDEKWNFGKADIEKPSTDGYTVMNAIQLVTVSAVLTSVVFLSGN